MGLRLQSYVRERIFSYAAIPLPATERTRRERKGEANQTAGFTSSFYCQVIKYVQESAPVSRVG